MRFKIWFLMMIFLLSMNTLYAEEYSVNGMVVGHAVNLRADPNWAAVVIEVLNQGCMLKVLEIQHQWYRVRLSEGGKGWIYKDYVTTQQSLIESHTRFLIRVQELIDFAKSFIGTKYSYGGVSPLGFDCSGYTMFIYSKFGYRLPHNALSQMRLGEAINRWDLALGDLVFFSTRRTSNINHVGIYLGEGDFIHASSGSGRIRISSIEERYYSKRYRGARRILNDEPT